MAVLEVEGARLYCESAGSGPPLVLVPGGNGTAHIFGAIAQQLAERYRVISYDRRGFARSELDGAQDYDRRLETDADDLREVVERLAGGPASVFGPSSGAIVVMEALIRHPAVMKDVIAYEPPAMRQLPDGERWLGFFDHRDPVGVELQVDDGLAYPRLADVAQAREELLVFDRERLPVERLKGRADP